jgi:sugar O-acyltransferase (sialic acid O-acetyltransferase NeuD family)
MANALEKVVLLGAGGHARVLLDVLEQHSLYEIVGFVDANPALRGTRVNGFPVLGDDDLLPELSRNGVRHAVVAIGSTRLNARREFCYRYAVSLGFHMLAVIADSSYISPSAKLGESCSILHQAVVGAGSCLGRNVIVNAGAIVEHDCWIEDHVHIAAAACVAGNVRVGENSYLGLGCRVRQGIKIGRNVMVSMGSIVVKDLPDGSEL